MKYEIATASRKTFQIVQNNITDRSSLNIQIQLASDSPIKSAPTTQ
mgnify:CR=1 FL=1